MSINLNILECKVVNESLSESYGKGINLNILECKVSTSIVNFVHIFWVLI